MIDLALQTHPTPDQLEYLDLAGSSAYSLLTVIGDILDFSKIEAGNLDLCPVEFDMRDLMEGIVKAFSPGALCQGEVEMSYGERNRNVRCKPGVWISMLV